MSQSRELEQERRLALLDRRLRVAEDRIANALQMIPQAFNSGGGGDDSSSEPTYWCIGDGTAHVATGTWPTLTADNFTSDVYRLVGDSMELVTSDATIYWLYLDAMSTTAGLLMPCTLNSDGEGYDAILESCTKVSS